MLTREENELLVRIGPGTPMGDMVRRYWVPALLSDEIPEPDSPPVQVSLLGESLVAFRDSTGRIGLLDEHCSHRGTSLFYGRNEDEGLRCIYHGWKFDVEGRVLDTPAEPPDSRFKEKVTHTAYPAHEVNGMVFAYLGPAHKRPLFPGYEWADASRSMTYVTKSLLDCNYLQGLEGECDNSHTSFLHSGVRGATAVAADNYTEKDRAPRYQIEATDFGLSLQAIRAAESGLSYVRTTRFLMPLSANVPVASRNAEGDLDGFEVHFYTPLDDSRTWRFDFGFRRTQPLTEHDVHRRSQIGPDFRRIRRLDNHYLQDRDLQRSIDFTGIQDFLNEDACATESMGPIVDRSREHLGASDQGVIALRRFLLDAIRAHQHGEEPPHIVKDSTLNDFRHSGATAGLVESTANGASDLVESARLDDLNTVAVESHGSSRSRRYTHALE
ncbi:MAG: aromatic ring-hydroxylating dioxygenase subunit alpha [Chloroflexi bacterium]|nr:aromatic ring-hydroxylating dioxygenase subunit alpha [Chloroflexota bacterium]